MAPDAGSRMHVELFPGDALLEPGDSVVRSRMTVDPATYTADESGSLWVYVSLAEDGKVTFAFPLWRYLLNVLVDLWGKSTHQSE